jgi:hypothetical protein
MVKVTQIRRTCTACPSQWEGRTDDGQYVYVRSRHDYLRVSLGPTLDDAIFGENCNTIVDIDDEAAGYLEYEKLKKLTASIVEWPAEEGTETE